MPCFNNPLIYTDPDGEFAWLVLGLAIAGGYIGGLSSNDLELNPFKWDWNEPSTYFSIGIGMAAGALGGYGILNPGTVEYGTSFLIPTGQIGIAGYQNNWDFKWTNNLGQEGIVPLENIVDGNLSDVSVPSSSNVTASFHNSMNEWRNLIVFSLPTRILFISI